MGLPSVHFCEPRTQSTAARLRPVLVRIARVDCPVLYLEVAVFIFLLANPAFNFLTVIYGGTPSASLFVIVADGDCWG